MTRKTALKLLAAIAAVFTTQAKAQRYDLGTSTLPFDFDNIYLSLDTTTNIHVKRGREEIIISGEELWNALKPTETWCYDSSSGVVTGDCTVEGHP